MDDRVATISELLEGLKASDDQRRIREALGGVLRNIPRTPDALPLYEACFSLAGRLSSPADRNPVIFDLFKEVPPEGVFKDLYMAVTDAAIAAADSLDERHRRITELKKIATELPQRKEFLDLRRHAWKLLAGLADKPRYAEEPLERVARELPKSSDLAFYRRYTLLGILEELPGDDDFHDIYRAGMKRAMDAVPLISEPYYRKYALLHIAGVLKEKRGVSDLYKRAITGALAASYEMNDPFAKQHALTDMLREMPRTAEFFPMLQDLIEKSLSFFTVRKWMEDVEVVDVVDYILSAEDLSLNESKKKRFTREKYSRALSEVLEGFAVELTDVRFIETLRPYTHVWIHPKSLRDSVRKVVEHLESLTRTFHGREVERPRLLGEWHREPERKSPAGAASTEPDCIAIDLGATNTVIMRKKGGAQPEFVVLGDLSRRYDGTMVVPTILSSETNSIGNQVKEESPVVNIKQMLLEGNPLGRTHMERFLKLLYQELRKNIVAPGWFSLVSKGISDKIYITVPAGFQEYRNAMREIASRVIRGARVELIEEPLAAAVGYEVADKRDRLILLIDFGGSTLNIMLLRLNINEVHVVAKPDRAQMLGGADIDMWLAEHLAKKAGVPAGKLAYSLVSRAEEIKIELSRMKEAPFVWDGREVARITREELEEVLDAHDFYRLIDRSISYVLSKAEKVGVKKNSIEAVLLTGGSSQIPSFKEKVSHIFPELRQKNYIFDHSPLSAVGRGAALYGTKDIIDRHLGMAYAIRYCPGGEKEEEHSYTVILEKGEPLPMEKTFALKPARKLGEQREIYIELFEVPENLIARKWVSEGGLEFIKQEIQHSKGVALSALRTITLPFEEPLDDEVEAAFIVDDSGYLSIRFGKQKTFLDTGIRLQ